jgi:hypothetical protein
VGITTLTRTNRIIVGAASAVVLASALAACGSSGGSGGKGGSGASSGVVVQQGQGGRLSGTYSAADFWNWVPSSMYPSSITATPQGAYTTGDVVSVKSKYDFATMSCSDTLQETGGPEFGEEAYLLDQGQNSSGSQDFAYGAYEFPSAADAVAFVQAAAAKYAACGSFTASDGGTDVPVTLSVGPASAAQVPAANATADLRQTATINGKVDEAEFVMSADGNVVAFAESAGQGALPSEVSNARVVEQMLAAFAAGEAADVANHVPSDYTTVEPSIPADPSTGDRIAGTSWGEAS